MAALFAAGEGGVLTRHQLANVIHEAEFKGLFNEAHTWEAMERAQGRHKLDVLEQALELHASGSAGTKSPREDDRRDAKLHAAGYTVIRFTGREVEERPQLVRAKLEAARRQLGG